MEDFEVQISKKFIRKDRYSRTTDSTRGKKIHKIFTSRLTNVVYRPVTELGYTVYCCSESVQKGTETNTLE